MQQQYNNTNLSTKAKNRGTTHRGLRKSVLRSEGTAEYRDGLGVYEQGK